MRVMALIVFALLSVPVLAAERVLDGKMHHLRSGTEREWADFPQVAEGKDLLIRFEARANPSEMTLRLRHFDLCGDALSKKKTPCVRQRTDDACLHEDARRGEHPKLYEERHHMAEVAIRHGECGEERTEASRRQAQRHDDERGQDDAPAGRHGVAGELVSGHH